jgi:hypothetical protein
MFQANEFTSRLLSTPKGRRVITLLTARNRDPEKFIVEIHCAIVEVLPALETGYSYSSKDLIGPDICSGYSIGVSRAAGICFAHLVDEGVLPLTFHRGRRKYPLRYRLTQKAVEDPVHTQP